MGFRRGAYICQCKDGFYMPNRNKTDTNYRSQETLNPNYFKGELHLIN